MSAKTHPVRNALAPLRLPAFARLAFAHTINEFGDWFGFVALTVLVFDQTGSVAATTLLLLGTRFVPAILAPGLVTRIESVPIRLGLPAVFAAEAAAFVGLALLAKSFALAPVVALAALDGALALTGRALTRATAAAVLAPSGRLRQGNALINVGFTAAAAAGPALAGLTVAGVGVQTALFGDACSFLLAGLVVAQARDLPQAKPEPLPWRARVRQGLSHVWERPLLRRLILAQALAFVFFAAVIPIEVVYVKRSLGGGDAGYGVLLASWGAGMVVGGLAFAAMGRASLRLLTLGGTVAVGGAYIGIGVAPSLLLACLISVVGGTGNGIQWVGVISAVQGITGPSYQARVVGLLESAGAAMPGVGYVLGGAAAHLISPRASFLIAGAGVLAVAAIAVPVMGGRDWRSAENGRG